MGCSDETLIMTILVISCISRNKHIGKLLEFVNIGGPLYQALGNGSGAIDVTPALELD